MINSPSQKAEMVMRALVYHGPGQMAWEDVPKPEIANDTDAIVRVDATTICGTDLHILKGDLPAVTDGRILGHEAVGTVDSVGSGVKTVKAGDRVLVSCVSVWGACGFCREGRPGQGLGGGGWILGYMIGGTQAEYARVPVLTRGGRRADGVAGCGAGRVWLFAIMGCHLFSPSHIVAIDLADSRLD